MPALTVPDLWKPDVRIGDDADLRAILASIGRSGEIPDLDEQLMLVRRLNEFFGVDWLQACAEHARTGVERWLRIKPDGSERSPLARFVKVCSRAAMDARNDGHLTRIALEWLFAREVEGKPRPPKPPHLRPLGTMTYEQMRRQAKAEKKRAKEHAEGIKRRAAKRLAQKLARRKRAADRNKARRAAKAARKAAARARAAMAAQASPVAPPAAAMAPEPPPPAAESPPPRRRIVTPPPAPARPLRPSEARHARIRSVPVDVIPSRSPKK